MDDTTEVSFYEAVAARTVPPPGAPSSTQEVAADPELRPVYPSKDLGPAEEHLRLFLIQYWGGPGTYPAAQRPEAADAARALRDRRGRTRRLAAALFAQVDAKPPAYLDPKQPVEAQVSDYMQRMTLKEKVGQLNLPCVYVDELGRDIPSKMVACRRFAAGTYTQEIGPGCGFFTLANEILHDVSSAGVSISTSCRRSRSLRRA